MIGPAPDAGAVLADLVECLAAIGRSMQDEFDPRRFLEEFSAWVERLGQTPSTAVISSNVSRLRTSRWRPSAATTTGGRGYEKLFAKDVK